MRERAFRWALARRAWLRGELEPVRKRLQGVLTCDDLAAALDGAGVRPGATVLAHVSMNELFRTAPEINPGRLIALLKELLTEQGTLMVLTSPFDGLEADYVASNPTFDVRRTPSRMGLMTELFRRMPDTIRSLHPTHPVAGWGAHAAELLEHHHEGETFGETSPFALMREGGLVLGIGAGIRNGYTSVHVGEWLLPPAREYAFSTERATVTINAPDRSFAYTFRPLRGRLDRPMRRIERDLRRMGAVRYRRHAGLLVSCAPADQLIEGSIKLIEDGRFFRSGVPGA